MKKSSIWTWVISRLFVVGLLFCAASAQAAMAKVPAVTSVVNRGVIGGAWAFDVTWNIIEVPDLQLSPGICYLSMGTKDKRNGGTLYNFSNGFPYAYLCNASTESRACFSGGTGGTYNLACVGNLFISRNGYSGTLRTTINTGSNLGQAIENIEMCTVAQRTETGEAAVFGPIPGTCYSGFPTAVNATCSIDTPELLLDHGSLNPLEVNGNVKEMDVDISCSPDVTVSVFTAGGNALFFGNGSISSTITIDGQNPRRASISGSRTFKLKSVLSASGTPMPSNYGNSTTLMINIE
ncbi:MrpH family fimbial adhesin [Comamonas testosteroni]|uniref:MrpH family fimbial adhesin n=1 Tax=Comamonas testosteroni TaxID=285 RepID=UPI000A85C8B4|nr:hypothetical protein [Comamonas testosteroni]